MKKLSREELKSVTGGVAAIIDCCVSMPSGTGGEFVRCGMGPSGAIELAQEQEAEGYPGAMAYCDNNIIWSYFD